MRAVWIYTLLIWAAVSYAVGDAMLETERAWCVDRAIADTEVEHCALVFPEIYESGHSGS
jgi:hypothetical protein